MEQDVFAGKDEVKVLIGGKRETSHLQHKSKGGGTESLYRGKTKREKWETHGQQGNDVFTE